MTPGETIEHYLKRGRLVVFVGAGCSMLPPTKLPSWWAVNRTVIQALAVRAHGILPEAHDLAGLIVERQDTLKFPPEYFAEVVVNSIGQSYFDVLRMLDSRTPNAVHETLARLAKMGYVKVIVTTNFDRAIEAAFERHAVNLDVRFRQDQIQELGAELSRLDSNESACQLLKIHGSANVPETLIDTLSQRKKGLSVPTVQCIKHLLKWGHWLFLGYSGADLEADPNYLFLRASKAESQGFTWLVQSGKKTLNAVQGLVDFYEKKASLQEGTLPDWLARFLPPPSTPPRIDVSTVASTLSMVDQAASWANDIGDFSCATVLTLLADAAAQSQPAKMAMECLYEQHPFSTHLLQIIESGDLLTISCESASGASLVERVMLSDPDKHPLILYRGVVLDATALRDSSYCFVSAKLAELFRACGRIDDALDVCQHALAASAAIGSLELFAGIMGQYGNLHRGIGQLSAAEHILRRAIGAAVDVAPVRGNLLNDLAGVLNEQGRVAEARAAVQQALDIRTAMGDEIGRAGALCNLATFLPPLQAERQYAEALSIFERLGNESGRGDVLVNLGKLHQRAGNWAQSFDLYSAAQLSSHLIANERMLAMALHGQAVAREEQKQADAAFALYHHALQIAERTEFTSECASIHNNLGRHFRDKKDADRTFYERQQALALYEQLDSPKGRADTWYAMGVDAYALENLPATIEPFRRAFIQYTELKDAHRRLESGNNLAAALYDNGQVEQSIAVYEDLLPEAERQQNPVQVRMIIGLGKCILRNGRTAEGVALFKEGVARQMQFGGLPAAWGLAEEVARKLRLDFGLENVSRLDLVGAAFNDFAKQLASKEQYDEALTYLLKLREIASKGHDAPWLARALANIGYVQKQAGRKDEAIEALTAAVQAYRKVHDANGAKFPLSHLIPLLSERQEFDALAAVWTEQAFCDEALGENSKAAESYARAASFWLAPFALDAVGSLVEAQDRANNAHKLLIHAKPLLSEGSTCLARAEYDLAFCRKILEQGEP